MARPKYLDDITVEEVLRARLKELVQMGQLVVDEAGSGIPGTARTMDMVHEHLGFREVADRIGNTIDNDNFKSFANITSAPGGWIKTPEATARETAIGNAVRDLMTYMNREARRANIHTALLIGGNPSSETDQTVQYYHGATDPILNNYIPKAIKFVLFLYRYATANVQEREGFGELPVASGELQAAAGLLLSACQAYADCPQGDPLLEMRKHRACEAVAHMVGTFFFVYRDCSISKLECLEEVFLCAFCYNGETFKPGQRIKGDAWPVMQLLRMVVHFYLLRHAQGPQQRPEGASEPGYTHAWGPPLDLPLPLGITDPVDLTVFCRTYFQSDGQATPGANFAIMLRRASRLAMGNATMSHIVFETDPKVTGDDTIIYLKGRQLTLGQVRRAPQRAHEGTKLAYDALARGLPTMQQFVNELVARGDQGTDWGIKDYDYFDDTRGRGFHNDSRNNGEAMQQMRNRVLGELALARGLLDTTDMVSRRRLFFSI